MNERENQPVNTNISTEPKPEIKIETELQPDDWLCIACSKKITSDKERFFYREKSEFQFKNPGGYIFDIITFDTTECIEEGEPSMEFTWFPEHSWSFAICSRCNLHLGWKYSGKHSFYGLIKARLVKGQTLYN